MKFLPAQLEILFLFMLEHVIYKKMDFKIIVCDKFVNGYDTEGSDFTLHCLTKLSCDSSETTAGERN